MIQFPVQSPSLTRRAFSRLILCCAILCGSSSSRAEEPDPEGIRFFEQKIRPMLIEHCYECHSAESKTVQGGLQVDLQSTLQSGGDTGPAIIPGKPSESLLLATLRYTGDSYDMPPKGKLPDAVIANFEKWIEMGAPDPRTGDATRPVQKGIDFVAGRQFWSLQPPRAASPPAVKESTWPQGKMDYFILAALEKEGLKPAQAADRRTLIRRLYFDLTGLRPTFEETEAFASSTSPQAYEDLVNQLLSSPHYGERWGRHWLDVVRYAEDNVNMGPHNGPYPHAYRFRDWVIQAINADMPYDEFIRYQLAADLLPDPKLEDLAALGMIGLSPQYHKELLLSQTALETVHADEWEDRVDIIGRGLMGLTVACARCHDHKYDPISIRDYYAIAGVFASIRQRPIPILPKEDIAKSQPARDAAAKLQQEIKTLTDQITALKKQKPESENDRSARDDKVASLQLQITEKNQNIQELTASTPHFVLPMVDAVTEEQVRFEASSKTMQKFAYYPDKPRDLPVMIRGSVTSLGEIVPRRFLEVLSPNEPVSFKQGSGRLELANAISSPQNPLTARVFVNRVWQHYFGEGIVDTPSNFGVAGSAPSHPELLDDLAVSFMQQGWSLKWLQREILLSATYRQSSQVTSPIAEEKDPGNRLLWKFNRRRLDAESLHDAFLIAGGNLNPRMEGPSGEIDDPEFNRRAVYAMISRKAPSQFLQVNDFPDPTIHAEQRTLTTTPLQQLFVLNSPFIKNEAIHLSRRVQAGTPESRIRQLFQLVFARNATDEDVRMGLAYLQASSPPASQLADTQDNYEFKGQRAKVKVPSLGETYTVSLWFQNSMPHLERPVTGYLFSRGDNGSPQADGDHLGISGNSTPLNAGRIFIFNGNRTRENLRGKTVLAPNQWYQVTLVREAERVRVYLNDALEPEIDGVLPITYSPEGVDLFLGGRNDGFANFHGQLGGVTLFRRALSGNESADHYREGISKSEIPNHAAVTALALASSPYAYWPVFQGDVAGPRLADLSSHQHHGVFEGSTKTAKREMDVWTMYCHALLCSNELLFVD